MTNCTEMLEHIGFFYKCRNAGAELQESIVNAKVSAQNKMHFLSNELLKFRDFIFIMLHVRGPVTPYSFNL